MLPLQQVKPPRLFEPVAICQATALPLPLPYIALYRPLRSAADPAAERDCEDLLFHRQLHVACELVDWWVGVGVGSA